MHGKALKPVCLLTEMRLIDLNSELVEIHTSVPLVRKEVLDEFRQNDLCSTMDFAPAYEFRCCVERYQGNYKIKSFSCWDQFLSLAFAQLTFRESLRDIEACLRATPTNYKARGLGSGFCIGVSR